MSELVWVACSIREFGDHIGSHRHLIRKKPNGRGYALTTQCGTDASVEGIWRSNRTKPKCARCAELEPTR